MNEPAASYWDQEYRVGIEHHARQNEQLARDFSRHAQMVPEFRDALHEKLVVEIGCGTGDLTSVLTDIHYCPTVGTDLSALAVEIASIRFPHLFFQQHDILRDPPFTYGDNGEEPFEVAVASNVLEHFQDPHAVVMKMFEFAPTLVIVGPYNQPITDGYDAEGGAGHASRMTRYTFSPYSMKSWMLFKSEGWSCETSEYQFATILERQ